MNQDELKSIIKEKNVTIKNLEAKIESYKKTNATETKLLRKALQLVLIKASKDTSMGDTILHSEASLLTAAETYLEEQE